MLYFNMVVGIYLIFIGLATKSLNQRSDVDIRVPEFLIGVVYFVHSFMTYVMT